MYDHSTAAAPEGLAKSRGFRIVIRLNPAFKPYFWPDSEAAACRDRTLID